MTPVEIAYYQVVKAIRKGEIVRPDTCELCGTKGRMSGHHWNGYDNALDLWFICQKCNSRLQGPKYHSGKVSKEEARDIVTSYEKRKIELRFPASLQDELMRLDEILTIQEVAKYLRLSSDTVRNWCKRKDIRAFKAGGGWRVHRSELARFIKKFI